MKTYECEDCGTRVFSSPKTVDDYPECPRLVCGGTLNEVQKL